MAKEEKDNIVSVAGKERKVKFPVSAMIKLEKEAGITIGDLEDEETMKSVQTILALVWAGLITDDPDLTMDYLADNLEMNELNEIATKVANVIGDQGKND